jgi:hypothetical protein
MRGFSYDIAGLARTTAMVRISWLPRIAWSVVFATVARLDRNTGRDRGFVFGPRLGMESDSDGLWIQVVVVAD